MVTKRTRLRIYAVSYVYSPRGGVEWNERWIERHAPKLQGLFADTEPDRPALKKAMRRRKYCDYLLVPEPQHLAEDPRAVRTIEEACLKAGVRVIYTSRTLDA